jgi:hypothetical protein
MFIYLLSPVVITRDMEYSHRLSQFTKNILEFIQVASHLVLDVFINMKLF